MFVKNTMIGPLIHYMYHGFFYNDNHDPVFQLPCKRSCSFFIKDCSRIIEAFGDNINDHKKGEILYFKVITASFMDTMNSEDFITLRQNKEVEINVFQLYTKFCEWSNNLNELEKRWFSKYIFHLNDVILSEGEIEDSDIINFMLAGTHGRLFVKNENTLCICR